MKKLLLSSLAASTLVFGDVKVVDVTPLVGYVYTKKKVDLKDHKVIGVSVGFKRDTCKLDKLEATLLQSIEKAEYENSSKDTSITRFSLNGIKEYGINDVLSLYGLVGLGYESINKELYSNNSGSFFNYGVGATYKIQDDYKLRFDIRDELKFDGDRNIIYTLGLVIPFGEQAQKDTYNTIVTEKQNTADTKTQKSESQDSDNDGVNDAQDVCPQTPLDTKVDALGCALPKELKVVVPAKTQKKQTKEIAIFKPESLKVLFDSNKATIQSVDMDQINKYVDYLQKVPTAKILLVGHTDSDGNPAYNLTLSFKRADAIKTKLILLGVDANRIKTKWYGDTEPLVPNTTAKNKALNRRVEATIIN